MSCKRPIPTTVKYLFQSDVVQLGSPKHFEGNEHPVKEMLPHILMAKHGLGRRYWVLVLFHKAGHP